MSFVVSSGAPFQSPRRLPIHHTIPLVFLNGGNDHHTMCPQRGRPPGAARRRCSAQRPLPTSPRGPPAPPKPPAAPGPSAAVPRPPLRAPRWTAPPLPAAPRPPAPPAAPRPPSRRRAPADRSCRAYYLTNGLSESRQEYVADRLFLLQMTTIRREGKGGGGDRPHSRLAQATAPPGRPAQCEPPRPRPRSRGSASRGRRRASGPTRPPPPPPRPGWAWGRGEGAVAVDTDGCHCCHGAILCFIFIVLRCKDSYLF